MQNETREKFITALHTACNNYETQTLTLRWNITNSQPKRKKDLEKIRKLITQYNTEEHSILELKHNLINLIKKLKTGPNVYVPLTNIGARIPISSSSVLKNEINDVINQYEDEQLLPHSPESPEKKSQTSFLVKSPGAPPSKNISPKKNPAPPPAHKAQIDNLQKRYRNRQDIIFV